MCANIYLCNYLAMAASFISGYGFNYLQLISFTVKWKYLNRVDPSATYDGTF